MRPDLGWVQLHAGAELLLTEHVHIVEGFCKGLLIPLHLQIMRGSLCLQSEVAATSVVIDDRSDRWRGKGIFRRPCSNL